MLSGELYKTQVNSTLNSSSCNQTVCKQLNPGLHDAVCLTDSFVFTPGHFVNF